MRRSSHYFVLICRVLMIVSLISVCGLVAFGQTEKGLVTLENLLRALADKPPLPAAQLVKLLNQNGVDFELTEETEERIKSVGKSYSPAAMTSILEAVRRNFRAASARNSPLQVQYRLVAGNSIDFFLRQNVKKDWQMLDIDGKVSVVPNATYKTLVSLARTFSVPFQGQYFDLRNSKPKPEESGVYEKTEEALGYAEQQFPIFVGSGGYDTFPIIFSSVPDLIGSLENPSRPWRILVQPKLDDDFGSPILKPRDISLIPEFCRVLTEDENRPEEYKQGPVLDVIAYLSAQFSPATNALLVQCTSPRRNTSPRPGRTKPADVRFNPLLDVKPLLDDLNRVLRGPLLSEKFSKGLGSAARTATIPSEEERIRLNRRFLVGIYKSYIRPEFEPSLHFIRQLQKEDFAQLEDLGRFYEYITRNNLPTDFGYLKTSLQTGTGGTGGCAEDLGPTETTTVTAPYLAMWIAVFENTTDKPLRVGNFALRENPSDRLRTPEEEAKIVNGAALKQVQLYPFGLLQPTEKIIVPLQLVLMYPDDLNQMRAPEESQALGSSAITSTQFTTAADEAPFRRVPQVSLPSGQIKTATLLEILKRPPLTFTTQHSYLFGPSVKIENIDLNQTGYLVRSFNPDKPMITSSGFLGASCPYLHTYDWTTKSWLNEGTVITGFDSKLKESTDVKLLQRFQGRILIEERDAEDSFIDSIVVRATTLTGEEVLFYPRNDLLLRTDGKYLKLSQGQRVLVDFDLAKEIQAVKYQVEVSGYYLPYKLSQRKPLRN